ncbi:nucleoporin subcomplex protein binding to Pom34-domain-containing protein [Spinellus fusiger]|nr:nucleoporin subcomplex protein binding to Pom34-domain-containing protein [Spinellus fusiger]
MTPSLNIAGPFQTLLDAIEHNGQRASSDSFDTVQDNVQTLLAEKTKELQQGLDYFLPPSEQAQQKLKAGANVTVDKKTVAVDTTAKESICELSRLLHLNEMQAAAVWHAAAPHDSGWKVRATVYYYQERLALLQCVSSLVKYSLSDPSASLASTALETLIKEDYIDTLITQWQHLSQQQIPNHLHYSEDIQAWVSQNLNEQKSLLDLLFLIHLNRRFSPQQLIRMIKICIKVDFGHTPTFETLPPNCKELHHEVCSLMSLVAVQGLCLSTKVIHGKKPSGQWIGESPEDILQLYSLVSTMNQSDSVFLLGWACCIEQLHQQWKSEETCPPPYCRILQSVNVDIQSTMVLDGLACIQTIAESDLCNKSTSQNGYRIVCIELLNSFMQLLPPPVLKEHHYNALVDSVCSLYQQQSELCHLFWKRDPHNHPLLSTAIRRFPLQTHLIRLLSALTPVEGSAKDVFELMKTRSSITVVLADDTLMDDSMYPLTPLQIVSSQRSVAGIQIDTGTKGTLLSSGPTDRIVQWHKSYSGWHLLVNYLAGYQEKGHQELDSMLGLIHGVLRHKELVSALIECVELAISPFAASEDSQPLLITVLCDLLTYCSTLASVPVSTITQLVSCLGCLLQHYPEAVWNYVTHAPCFDVEIHTLLPSQSTLKSIIRASECKIGSYRLLFAYLDLTEKLLRNGEHQWWQADNDTLGMRAKVLHSHIAFTLLDLYPSYTHWRYQHLTERFQLGSKMLSIFIYVLKFYNTLDTSLVELRTSVVNHFLYQATPYSVSGLLNAIAEGPKLTHSLYEANRLEEAESAEEMIQASYQLIHLLLMNRLGNKEPEKSALEQLLFSTVGDGKLLLKVAQSIHSTGSLPVLATQLISLLARTTAQWKQVPKFAEYLGDRDQLRDVLRAYLKIAKDASQDSELLTAVWQMMTVLLRHQPSLAVLFLECGDYVLPSPKSAIQKSKKPQEQEGYESAVRGAVDLLAEWQVLATEMPIVLSSLLHFLATFWHTAFDHYGLVQRTRSDNALWHALGEILLNPTDRKVGEEPITMDMDACCSSDHTKVRHICCSMMNRAYALDIIALEIHLTGHPDTKTTSRVSDRLPAGLKNLLVKMAEPSKLAWIRESWIKPHSEDVALEPSAEILVGLMGISSTYSLFCPISPMNEKEYGDGFVYDLQVAHGRVQSMSDAMTIKYIPCDDDSDIVTPNVMIVRQVQKAGYRFITTLSQANHHLSFMSANRVLVESLKRFMLTTSFNVADLLWAQRVDTCLFDLIQGLYEHIAVFSTRTDAMSIETCGILIAFTHNMMEEWIRLYPTTSSSNVYNEKTSQLLLGLARLVSLPGLKSFDYNLLEIALITVHSLCQYNGHTAPALHASFTEILHVVCPLFQQSTVRAIQLSKEAKEEEAIKNSTMITLLLRELLHPRHLPAKLWLPILIKHRTLHYLLVFIHESILLRITEMESQTNTKDFYSLQISPFADHLLDLLLTMCMDPTASAALVDHGMLGMLRTNPLTPFLEQGTLNTFISFQGTDTIKEHNPLHSVWCQMLAVFAHLLRNSPSPSMVEHILGLLEIYGAHLENLFETANSYIQQATSLSKPVMQELDHFMTVMLYLVKRRKGIRGGTHLFNAFQQGTFPLLRIYFNLLSRPRPLESILGSEKTQATRLRMARVARTSLLALVVLCEGEEFLTDITDPWPIYDARQPQTLEALTKAMLVGQHFVDQWESQQVQQVWRAEQRITSLSVVLFQMFQVTQRYLFHLSSRETRPSA